MSKLTPVEVKERVDKIAAIKHDDEESHLAEDALHRDVLKAIAEGCPNPAELAAEALKTVELKFERWCA